MAAKTAPAAEEIHYPTLERFLESADEAAAKKLYGATREKLEGLASGPKGPAAKKAMAGIAKVEQVLLNGIAFREQAAAAKKGRR